MDPGTAKTRDPFELNDELLLVRVVEVQQRNDELEELLSEKWIDEEINNFLLNLVVTLSMTAKEADPDTWQHQRRVSALAEQMAIAADLSERDAETCRLGGLLHDIGKVAKGILPLVHAPRHLSDDEWTTMQKHTVVGRRIMQRYQCTWDLAAICGGHHEKLDGSGYPYGKKGDQIPEIVGFVSVADFIEATSADRCYRPKPPGLQWGLENIRENRGILFHELAVDSCMAVFIDGSFQFPGTPCVQ